MPKTWSTKTKAVYNTWGQRCHITYYFFTNTTSYPDYIPREHVVALKTKEGLLFNRQPNIKDYTIVFKDQVQLTQVAKPLA